MRDRVHVVIIGGGIAGVSLAARLAPIVSVLVIEAEEQVGVHATGRSAALLVEAYGPPAIRQLTGRSRAFFEHPPPGFSEAGLARRRGGLVYAGEADLPRLEAEYELAQRTASVVWLDRSQVVAICPLLRPDVVHAGFLEPGALDLDTHALLQGFLRQARSAGAEVRTQAAPDQIERHSTGWRVDCAGERVICDIIVNAAGAWADQVAQLAGVSPVGLQPMRRSAATLPVPPEVEAMLANLPFVAPVDESFYFKPEARSLMVSLADETPSAPCSAFPEDLDIAIALERFHEATVVPRARPLATWAGLRTFAADRKPVIGYDGGEPAFFWCAGQGGYGIQTAPALSDLAAKLLLQTQLEPAEAALASILAPQRLR